ncbi:MAG: hypothetical protein IPK82_29165 [Polyangiaceae bacterium]|nr:hypothetical protein [Polyangiaceae bacterium]
MAVQFKYGNVHDHEYKVGNRVIWGRPQIGDPKERRVVVQGIAGCPTCDKDNFFDILIIDSVIKDVMPQSGLYDYRGSGYVELGSDSEAGIRK